MHTGRKEEAQRNHRTKVEKKWRPRVGDFDRAQSHWRGLGVVATGDAWPRQVFAPDYGKTANCVIYSMMGTSRPTGLQK